MTGAASAVALRGSAFGRAPQGDGLRFESVSPKLIKSSLVHRMPLRLVFMGTPDFAVPSLIELAARGHDIAAVYTRAPKPAGRGMDMQVTPVEREARRLGLPVFTPKTLRDAEAQATFASHQADAAVVVAYGLILPKPVLDAPKLGCFNVHASLLPRWRGAAPINRAVMAGDAESGVTIMKMDEGLDTGAMAMVERTPITMDMTAGDLHDLLAPLGADLMTRALAAAEHASLTLTPQPADGVTYAEKIAKSETRIDWGKRWRAVHDHIRGLSPFPGAWFELDGVRVKALRSTRGEGSGEPGTILDDRLTIACGDGAVRLTQVQRAGKQPMVVEDFLRGTRIGVGVRAG
jgi:methionyl-tRNA formyltransferase